MKRESKIRIRKLQLNDRGVTLIELIVALLIMGIIVVPLMGMFSRAAKTNTFNSENADADIVAQNIMEAIKVYGLDSTEDGKPGGAAKQVITWNEGKKVLGVIPENAFETTASGDIPDPDGYSYNAELDQFRQNNDNKYIYNLTGVKEGYHTYDVKIEFDSNYIHDGDDVNTKDDEYDFDNFTSESTVFINPLSRDMTFDEEVLRNIYELNAERMNELKDAYDVECQEVTKNRNKATRDYEEKVAAGEIDPAVVPAPDVEYLYPMPTPRPGGYDPQIPNDFYTDVKRTMLVEISEDPDASNSDVTAYKINSKLNYYVQVDELIDDKTIPVVGEGYCTNASVKIEKKANPAEEETLAVYIMYVPYPYMSSSAFYSPIQPVGGDPAIKSEWQAFIDDQNNGNKLDMIKAPYPLLYSGSGHEVSFANEDVEILNKTGKNVELYLVVQGGNDTKYSMTYKLPVNITNSRGEVSNLTGTVTLYTNLNSYIAATNAKEVKDTLWTFKPETHRDKLVNITITVQNDDVTRIIKSTIQK